MRQVWYKILDYRPGLWIYPLTVALVYLFLVPVSNNWILYPLLACFAILAIWNLSRSKSKLPAQFYTLIAAWMCFVVLGSLIGILRGAEDWARTLVFFLLWPALFGLVSSGFSMRFLKPIFLAGAIATIAASSFLIVNAMLPNGFARSVPFLSVANQLLALKSFRDTNGMLSMSATVIPTLAWWGSMWIAALWVKNKSPYLPPNWVSLLSAIFAITGSLLAWRRATVLVLLITPLLLIAVQFMSATRRRKFRAFTATKKALSLTSLAYLIAFGLAIPLQPQIISMVSTAVTATIKVVSPTPQMTSTTIPSRATPSPSPSSSSTAGKSTVIPSPSQTKLTVLEEDLRGDAIRTAEGSRLLSPSSVDYAFFGRGFGASIDREGLTSDVIKPWQTELQYHAIFYWTGFSGLLLLIFVAWRYLALVRAAELASQLDSARDVLLVSFVGAISGVLLNATNPYLQAPGHLWVVFFPIMIATSLLRQSGQLNKQNHF